MHLDVYERKAELACRARGYMESSVVMGSNAGSIAIVDHGSDARRTAMPDADAMPALVTNLRRTENATRVNG
jgi:hypothetical protein